LRTASARHGERAILLCSFQKEESVILDELLRVSEETGAPLRVVTIDTGVLFEETMSTWRAFEERFGVRIEVEDATGPNGPWTGPGRAPRRPSVACTRLRWADEHGDSPPADTPARAGVGGDPRDARGGGRIRAPRAPVQRRQGLDRAAAARREGVPPRTLSVSDHARGHRTQLPRGDRVPRPARGRARRAADRRQR